MVVGCFVRSGQFGIIASIPPQARSTGRIRAGRRYPAQKHRPPLCPEGEQLRPFGLGIPDPYPRRRTPHLHTVVPGRPAAAGPAPLPGYAGPVGSAPTIGIHGVPLPSRVGICTINPVQEINRNATLRELPLPACDQVRSDLGQNRTRWPRRQRPPPTPRVASARSAEVSHDSAIRLLRTGSTGRRRTTQTIYGWISPGRDYAKQGIFMSGETMIIPTIATVVRCV